MRFFLGGVPFGCDNIGDEAILAAAVSIVRRNFKDAKITDCTNTPEATSKLLNVDCVPLYVFKKELPLSGLEAEMKKCDAFMWTGATGLSDYPKTALTFLKIARKCGLKTLLWGVGMDSQLNPAFFKVSGKKLKVLKIFSALTLGLINFAKIYEKIIVKIMQKKIARSLSKCNRIIVRDPQTRDELWKCSPKLPVVVGADSAVILDEADPKRLEKIFPKDSDVLCGKFRNIGICISAQRKIADMDSLAHTLDEILKNHDRRMIVIPMNPKTDMAVMQEAKGLMKYARYVVEPQVCEEPEDVLAIASICDVVISSRLHLLILSANVGTPIIGISRGSKVDNFLSVFGLQSVGTVNNIDFATLENEVIRLLPKKPSFYAIRHTIYEDFGMRIKNAENLLRGIFN